MLAEARDGRLEVVDLERDVVREPDRDARSRIGPSRGARRVGLDEQVELVVADLEPRSREGEVRAGAAPPRSPSASP